MNKTPFDRSDWFVAQITRAGATANAEPMQLQSHKRELLELLTLLSDGKHIATKPKSVYQKLPLTNTDKYKDTLLEETSGCEIISIAVKFDHDNIHRKLDKYTKMQYVSYLPNAKMWAAIGTRLFIGKEKDILNAVSKRLSRDLVRVKQQLRNSPVDFKFMIDSAIFSLGIIRQEFGYSYETTKQSIIDMLQTIYVETGTDLGSNEDYQGIIYHSGMECGEAEDADDDNGYSESDDNDPIEVSNRKDDTLKKSVDKLSSHSSESRDVRSSDYDESSDESDFKDTEIGPRFLEIINGDDVGGKVRRSFSDRVLAGTAVKDAMKSRRSASAERFVENVPMELPAERWTSAERALNHINKVKDRIRRSFAPKPLVFDANNPKFQIKEFNVRKVRGNGKTITYENGDIVIKQAGEPTIYMKDDTSPLKTAGQKKDVVTAKSVKAPTKSSTKTPAKESANASARTPAKADQLEDGDEQPTTEDTVIQKSPSLKARLRQRVGRMVAPSKTKEEIEAEKEGKRMEKAAKEADRRLKAEQKRVKKEEAEAKKKEEARLKKLAEEKKKVVQKQGAKPKK